MRFCNTCRRRRIEGASFCAGCGSPFPDAEPWELPALDPAPDPAENEGPPGLGDLLDSPPPEKQRSRHPLALAVVALVVVALAAAGAIGITTAGHHSRPPAAARPATRSPAAALSSAPLTGTAAAQPGGTPASSPTVPAAAPQVGVAASMAGDPAAQPILSLLDKYFAAIDRHDYQAVIALFTPQAQELLPAAASFINGFLSTRDSAETLTGITTDTTGRTVALVTFTSHQAPANSIDHHQACTNWHISLFLEHAGDGYLIDKPPAGYAASYAPCQ